MTRFARDTGRPVTFLVMQGARDTTRWRTLVDAACASRAAGVALYPQVASRCFGVLMGHQSSRLNPFRTRPSFAALARLAFSDRIAALRRPDVRARLLAEKPVAESRPSLDAVRARTFDHLFPLGDDLDYEPTADASIGAIARREGRDPWEVAYDVMLRDDGRELLLLPLLNYGDGGYDAIHEMLANPLTVQGLGDGGAHCNVVCDASMTTYLLTHWVRDRTRGPRLGLEYAVRRLTRDAAELYGFADRGILAPGRKADVNLIDYDRLALRKPERVSDLPGGAGRLLQRSTGYVATIVAGEVTVAHGEPTDARPGRLVRL
jgi:N-acyl-D-aspartate/D-glutamate deacylase